MVFFISAGWPFLIIFQIFLTYIFSLFLGIIVPVLMLIVTFITFFVSILYATLRYNWQCYWITNKRILYRKGLIGYQISSILLERISDIILTRNILERILGFGSLHVQTFAGQETSGMRFGAEASLKAIPEPEETQKLIFKLIEEKRKREGLKF